MPQEAGMTTAAPKPRSSLETTPALRKIAPPFVAVCSYLVFLLILSGQGILQSTYSIAEQVGSTETSHRLVDDSLEAIRLDLFKIAVALRDALLNRSTEQARIQVFENERAVESQIRFLQQDATARHVMNIREIELDVRNYFQAIDPILAQPYSPDSHQQLQNALGRRQTSVKIAESLSKLNDLGFEVQQNAIQRSIRDLRKEIFTTLAIVLLLGTAAGGTALYRILEIQRINQQAHWNMTQAREKLKSLSHQLVSAQEAERKALSRELHDEIGQSLTALKLELANTEKLARSEGSGVTEHLQAIREIADQTLRATKNISLGLRPSMLDDLGLLAALNWFTAEFSRRTGVTVELKADGAISHLGDVHRTCVFRVVQEALTNCARHSKAARVTISLDAGEETLKLIVADDGVGFVAGKRLGAGLGLLSMQERAAELGGEFEITSRPGEGTSIQIAIPMTPAVAV
jgi:signal transduction histidine kinase